MKNVLFIAEPFYQYANKIKICVENYLGYSIDYLIIDNNDVTNTTRDIKLSFSCESGMEHHNQEAFFKENTKGYDVIFVLVYAGLNIELFRRFMQGQNNAVKILYLWDDVKRVKDFAFIKDLFDRIISFDRYDCETEEFEFLPLFYLSEYKYRKEVKDIDFSICGTLHSDRKYILDSLLKQFPRSKYNWKALLLTTKCNYWRLLVHSGFRIKKSFYISCKGYDITQASDILKRSRVVIDIAAVGQKGLTMRTIEALGAHTKIITTNQDIVNYDFYREDNVCIINRKNPMIPVDFFERPYIDIDEEIVDKYSLSSWVETIMKPYK